MTPTAAQNQHKKISLNRYSLFNEDSKRDVTSKANHDFKLDMMSKSSDKQKRDSEKNDQKKQYSKLKNKKVEKVNIENQFNNIIKVKGSSWQKVSE